jgi:two-component system cell cycle response regulator
MIAVVAHASKELRRQAVETLAAAGCDVHEAATVDDAIAACSGAKADVLLADVDLGDGIHTLIDRIKRDPLLFRTSIVLLADEHIDVPTVLTALDRGADDVLRTPLHPGDLVGRAFAAARTKALVEELTAQNDRLEEMVFFDELTRLRNRRAVLHELEMLLAGARRHGHSLSVLMIDIDRFKPINDSHGHRAGDEVLRAVAKRLMERLRTADLAGRLGGDELLVVLPNTDAAGAAIVADSIRESVGARAVRTSAGPIEVTVSIGSAQLEGEEDVTRLLEHADRALYAAKAGGRDRSVAA